MNLQHNTILITGGTSGIGLALAETLSAQDNHIIVLGRNADKLAAVKAAHPSFDTVQADVSDLASLTEPLTKIRQQFPALNIVINSAGTMSRFSLFDDTIDPLTMVKDIQINLLGTMAVDKLLLPQLVAQTEALIVNVSSGLANLTTPVHPAYSASKAGVHMFTDALREQLRFAGHDNVHVMELVPPLVAETNLEDSVSTDAPNNMKLADLVAEAITGMTANEIRVNAGYAAELRKLAMTDPDTAEHQMAQGMLANAFPESLE